MHKKQVTRLSGILVLLSALVCLSPLAPVHAMGTLEAITDFPGVVDGNTKLAQAEVSLPIAVSLSSNSVVTWDYLEPQFTNELGDEYAPVGVGLPNESPFNVSITPLGRRANFRFSSLLAGKFKITLIAEVDGNSYRLVREIAFKESTSNTFTRISLPTLPTGFKIEVESPDPNLDLRTTLRARVTYDGSWLNTGFNLVRLGKNGQELGGNHYSKVGKDEWIKFEVSADDYQRYGFTLRAAWNLPVTDYETYQANLIFQRLVPIKINFKSELLPGTYAWNDVIFQRYDYYSAISYVKIKFACPSKLNAKSKTFKCVVQAFANFDSAVLKKINLGSPSKYPLSGEIPATVCVYNQMNSYLSWATTCGADLGYGVEKSVNLYFDHPTSVTLPSSFASTGFTAVVLNTSSAFSQISSNGPKIFPNGNSYSWASATYLNQQKKAGSPSSANQKSLANWIRNAMQRQCAKLPTGFAGYAITFSKTLTSGDGVPGYLFTINKKLSLFVFPDARISPTSTTSDLTLWKNWGCGGSILF